MSEKDLGLYNKYEVRRTDRRDSHKEDKHYDCRYFVLDLDHDKYALPALESYKKACVKEYPELARELAIEIAAMENRFKETDNE